MFKHMGTMNVCMDFMNVWESF